MENLIAVGAVILIMTSFIAYTLVYLRRFSEDFTMRRLAFMVLILTMMGSMLNSLNYYLVTPKGFFSIIVAVNVSMLSMAIAILYLLWVSAKHKINRITGKMALGFSLLFAWNEISMGSFLFTIAYNPAQRLLLSGTSGIIGFFTSGINSILFVIPMVAEMLFILLYFKETKLQRIIFASLVAMAVLTPSMFQDSAISSALTIAFTASMVVFMIILFEWLANKRNTITMREMRKLEYLFVIFAVMSSGIFIGELYSRPFYIAWILYAVGMIAGMIFYFNETLGVKEKGKMVGWVKHPRFLFIILALSFLSELLLSGAILNIIQPAGTTGLASFPAFSLSLGGVTSYSLPAIALDIPFIIGAITNSYVFLIVMGVEMGALVVFRMRKLQWREKRINLTLALIAFATYTTFWPNFGNASYYSILPVWANAGSLEGMYPIIIGALLGSYALYAVLALLFGRRSYCSTLCPSAVMYGGTLGQSMISYNYASKMSRKNIGSKYAAAIYPFISVSWIFMLVFSYLSYETATGVGNFTLYGIDPIVFFSFFIWNFLWYVYFFSIPFIGMSPCRRYGWCTTGTFVGFFSKIGLFKLKVKSPDTCVTCPTKDCVSACEVGLGDLPGQFIKQGFFKSSKCVGAGSCIEACPYDNIFFYDIRNVIREKREKKISQRP